LKIWASPGLAYWWKWTRSQSFNRTEGWKNRAFHHVYGLGYRGFSFMQTFFTSDTHFDDEYAIQYFNRPFKSMHEMNAAMVERWNSVVSEQDLVYHLGDFTLDDIAHFTKWVGQLNGNIKILPGSHDQPWLKDFLTNGKVQVIAPLVSLDVPEILPGPSPQVIVLCHYAMQVWDRSNQDSWHLFGHSHGKLKGIGRSFDVGVDCTDFVPLSLDQVSEKMMHQINREKK
jgi:calcineurin-like phosphoesterase family protein